MSLQVHYRNQKGALSALQRRPSGRITLGLARQAAKSFACRGLVGQTAGNSEASPPWRGLVRWAHGERLSFNCTCSHRNGAATAIRETAAACSKRWERTAACSTTFRTPVRRPASRVRDALDLLLGDHGAAAAGDHAAVPLGDRPAGRVGDVLNLLLGDHGAAAAGDHAAVLLADQLAGGVGDALYLLLRHHRAAPAGDHLAVLFRHQLAGRVRHLLHDGVGDRLAHGVWHHLAMFLLHVVASASSAHFFMRHPGSLARPAPGALHLVVTGLAGAVVRPAGARIKLPAASLPAAAGHDRAGAVFSLDFPLADADLVTVLAVHGLAGGVFADALLLLGAR